MAGSSGVSRRGFLFSAGAATALVGARGFAEPDREVRGELAILDDGTGRMVPVSYMGLSYELAQLSEPGFFSADHRDLVAYFRLLSPHGVLRLGGNTSEFCWFRADASTPAPKLHVPPGNPAANWMPHRLFAIAPEAIDRLAGFLDATGWRCIYGVNFGNSTPERAAVEAAYVAKKVGRHLDYFQIGNEPDFYRDANNGTRPPGWDFNDYAAEWMQFADAISARVPRARFGGPDVGSASDWITRFGEEVAPKMGSRLVALTGHYYAEGPPDDPAVTTARLLRGDKQIAVRMKQIEGTAEEHSVVYRMTEGNSCYRGGKPGMSNAFASALWAGDYLLLLASLGCAGVNLHGGDSRFLASSLGDHTPGLNVAKKPQSMISGFYTPIASERGAAVHAMPIFYGMMLANQFAGLKLVQTKLQCDANATAYAARSQKGYRVAVFNKDEAQAIRLSLRGFGELEKATAWRLRAPSLDATEGVTLAGAEIEPHAVWSPKVVEPVSIRDGGAQLSVPAASAVLLFVE